MATTANETERAINKLTTGDFSSGGLLDPERFQDFFQDVQGRSDLLDQVRAVPVTAPSGAIPRLGVGSRMFQEVQEGQTAAEITEINQPSVDFQTVKMAGYTPVTWEAVNETIDDPVSTIINQLAQQFTLDLETLGSIGDTTSADPFVSINDGWLTIAESRGSPTYNHADSGTPQPINKTLFSSMLNKLPERYKETQDLAFLLSYDQMQGYKEYLTDRNTAAGDAMLMQQEQPTGFGYPIVTPKGWPDNQVMLTNLQNLCYVIQDNVRIKQTTEGAEVVKKDLESIINLIAHTDFQILESEGVVIGNNVAGPS